MYEFFTALKKYSNHPIFNAFVKDFYPTNNFFTRPLRAQDLANIDFFTPLSYGQYSKNANLIAQRLLTSIYEQDLIFLPAKGTFEKEHFHQFYDRECISTGMVIKNSVEDYVFSFLEDEISITGEWTLADFNAYTTSRIEEVTQGESSLLAKIMSSKDPSSATKFFLIQCAGDFLSEASAMGRNVLGNFGRHTSELFKIFIDEYGYAVHEKKHSTLFENLLYEAGMHTQIHYYWQFYTPASLALINYFHFISKNHCYFFRYLGALYFTEATLAHTTKSQNTLIKEVFNGKVDPTYFNEHAHIDMHHGQMAYKDLIVPIIQQYGKEWLREILIGFESFALLQKIADEELFYHIDVHDRIEQLKDEAKKLPFPAEACQFSEAKGALSVTHLHDVNELFLVTEGEIEIRFSPYKSICLHAGEKLIIPKGILHGSKVISNHCKYHVAEIEEST
jgi:mannose-6-phosphate isomerase-like protein (cupin superfamily)